MKKISYSECLKEMFALGRFGIKLELDTIAYILERLGSPEKQFFSIHIAGTNGKGSIASYIASILSCSGFRVGLYTSPHLIKFNERFSINGNMVSDEDIVESYIAVKKADTGERKATFFEISTAMAFFLFAKENVEWAVIETGMGGRLDATNVLQPVVTVISNLSIEHAEYLGDTLEKIAAEKGGIIKPNTPLVTGVTQDCAISVLYDIAKKMSAPVYQYGKDFIALNASSIDNSAKIDDSVGIDDSTKIDDLAGIDNSVKIDDSAGIHFTYKGMNVVWNKMETKLHGIHQIQNSAIALATCELLMGQKINKIAEQKSNKLTKQKIGNLTNETIRKGLVATKWAGRLEYIMQKPLILIDGAHNLDATEKLAKYLQKYHGQKNRVVHSTTTRLTMVIGILKDKPYKEMLTHLLPLADRIIFTKAKIDRSLEPKVLRDFAITFTNSNSNSGSDTNHNPDIINSNANLNIEIKIIENVGEAVEYAITGSDEHDCICIAGSLYVVGEAREKILKINNTIY